ncbi:MAG: COX15/CtaA family protein [Acidimicrobiales bacterium]|nr:COX15/CtaA family protein [Acidimicrobiales bacterium]
MSPARYLELTRVALWSLVIIVYTGAAVRLTGSGLGCHDWPNCNEEELVPAASYHGWIEFGNRMFTGVVALAVVAAVLGSHRRSPHRTDLVRLSWGLVAGVIAQILLGALLVRTDLDPRFTMGHFLLSMVLLWNAAVLHHRAGLDDAPTRQRAGSAIRRLTQVVFWAGGVVLVLGTVVTGSGPHSGSEDESVANRLPFDLREVTRIHSISALVLIAAVGGVLWVAHTRGMLQVRRAAQTVVSLLGAQIALGYWQYSAGVPEALVFVHIIVATIAWISIVRLDLEAAR